MTLNLISEKDAWGTDISTEPNIREKINAAITTINAGGGTPVRTVAPTLTDLPNEDDTMQWIDSSTSEVKMSWNDTGAVRTVVIATFP